LSGISLPKAVEVAQDYYIVPTNVSVQNQQNSTQRFEWDVKPIVHNSFSVPVRMTLRDVPDTAARSALIMDAATQRVLWQKNPEQVVPIASITKLMTVLVWFDHRPAEGTNHVYAFTPEDDTPGGKELDLPYGTPLTAASLLYASLIPSYNDAAMALSHTSTLSSEEFVETMNDKARILGMKHTQFVDQTGLNEQNVSTPYDVALLAREAFRRSDVQEITTLPDSVQKTVDGQQDLRFYTTNKLLFDDDVEIIAGKTGYIEEAGYCVVVQARHPRTNRDIIVVVLGTDSDDARFEEAKKLIDWTFRSHRF
ncbi:MAG TPA: serine hydrolase, partial [Patescibacteria group bacterium]|nr:serine hydrolase [Patescibacteria group bacterium]